MGLCYVILVGFVFINNANAHTTVPGNHWSNWSEWGPCQVSCGPGVRVRSRTCLHDPDVLYYPHCGTDYNEKGACHAGPCKAVLHGRGTGSEEADSVTPVQQRAIIDIHLEDKRSVHSNQPVSGKFPRHEPSVGGRHDQVNITRPNPQLNSSAGDMNVIQKELASLAQSETIQAKDMKMIFMGIVIAFGSGLLLLILIVVCQTVAILRKRRDHIKQRFSRENLLPSK